MKELFDKWRHWAGVDRPVFYSALAKAISMVTGPVTFWFITRYFTPEQQGYYYTFTSVLGLQIFLEMGFSQCVIQFASHEFAHLRFRPGGFLEGDPQARSRLVSLGRLATKWYGVMAVLAAVALGAVGHSFFWLNDTGLIAWAWPWWSLCLITGLSLALLPLLALLEGCNQLGFIYGLRTLTSALGALTVWTALWSGAGLFSGALVLLMSLLVTTSALIWRWSGLISELRQPPQGDTISWRREIWPFQWRIAVSWMSSFFAAQLFTPVVFHFHGPVLAGKLGMTLQLVLNLGALAYSWILPKGPRFGMLVKQGKYAELDKLFFKATAQCVGVGVASGVALLVALGLVQHYFPSFGGRFLGPAPASLLVVGIILNQIIVAQTVYLRAHKREPFMRLSVASSLWTGLLVVALGWRFGVWGACAAAAVAPIPAVILGTRIWRKCRRDWHGPLVA